MAQHIPNAVKQLERHVQTLPVINADAESGRISLNETVMVVQPWITEATALIAYANLDCWTARKLLQLLGFIIGSIEQHFQHHQQPPGYGLAQLHGAEDALTTLAEIARHPPRDSHYTNYLWNTTTPVLTYTGDAQERFFIHAVQQIDRLHIDSCTLLRMIASGNIPLKMPEAIISLQHVITNVREVHRIYRSFLTTHTCGQRNMEPHFFSQRFRIYKPRYPIHGQMWGGANAGNIASQIQFDYLLGTATPTHASFVMGRLPYLTREDTIAVQVDMQIPSITTKFLEALHLSPEYMAHADMTDLTAHLTQQDAHMLHVGKMFTDLLDATAQMAAIHWTLIHNYIRKIDTTLNEAHKAQMALRTDDTVSGSTFATTKAILAMRRNHLQNLRLAMTAVARNNGQQHRTTHA